MAQAATTASTSRVNRRFLFLALILAALSAVLVYAAISRSGGGSASAGSVPVVVAKSTIPPGTRITASMVDVKQLPSSVVEFQALSTSDSVVGRIARYPIQKDKQVLSSKLVDTTTIANHALSYVLEQGKHGMAVNAKEVFDVDDLALPNDHVDILWVPTKGAPAFVLLSDIEVTAVSQTIAAIAPVAPGLLKDGATPVPDADRTRTSDADPQPDAKTVTLMLSPEQAMTVLCAEWITEKYEGQMRFAVRSFGDTAPLTPNAPACPPTDLLARLAANG